jgi:hypothetical protein
VCQIIFSAYKGNYVIDDDLKDLQYKPPQWQDEDLNGTIEANKDIQYPICYRQGKNINISVIFKITNPAEIPAEIAKKIKIKALGKANNTEYNIEEKTVGVNKDQIKYSSSSKETLPNSIQFYDPLKITYFISFDEGKNWKEIGTMKTNYM